MPLSFSESPFTTKEEHATYLKLSQSAQLVAAKAYGIANAVQSPSTTSLLYGLADARFVGAASTEGASYASSLSELIEAFITAHHSRRAREDAGYWSFDKVARKKRWSALGVPSSMLVPTLATQLLLENVEAPEFEEELNELIRPDHAIVLKPSVGSGSDGLLCVSIDTAPLEHVPTASGAPRMAQTSTPAALPAGCVWVFKPKKSNPYYPGAFDPLAEQRTWIESEALRPYRRGAWFHELVLSSIELRGGPTGVLLVEPLMRYDQELCVLCVNGGAVQVLAGRANCMERLLMIEGVETLVAHSDFSPPSCRSHVLSAEERQRHTAMVLQQRVGTDPARRTLHESIRQLVATIGSATRLAAFRVDVFVRWGGDSMSDGAACERPADAALYLNEVESGFWAERMVGWFGMPLTDYAMRSWALGGDPAQRHALAAVSTSERWQLDGGCHADVGVLGSGGAPLSGHVERDTSAWDHRMAHGLDHSWPADHGRFVHTRIPSATAAIPGSVWLQSWRARQPV